MGFTHLHVHSEYSALDGMGKVEELLERAKELGQNALAITDHGTCSGLYDLFKLAPKHGIKPIYGCEFYLNDGEEENKNSHIVLLAKDNIGLTNIYKLHEYAHVYGFSRRPRITLEVLEKHKQGVICTSGCMANIIQRSLLFGEDDVANKWVVKFKELFEDDFYIELQDREEHEQQIVNKKLVQLANKYKVKYIATSDVHYALKSDYEVHDTLLCIQVNAKKSNEKRFRFSGNDYWLKHEDEMKLGSLTSEERLLALATTQEVVDKCHAELQRGDYKPKFYDIPKGKTEEQLLRELVTEKYQKEIVEKGLHSDAYVQAVKEELDVIEHTGYSGYHLIVADFVKYCRENGILVGDGRGSGAGCKVANIIGITRVEPTKHNLLFGRFLGKTRQPDYDIDFADNDAVFGYLQERYGVENVARIIAFGTLSAKAVMRRVFSVYEVPESIISQVSGVIPSVPGITLQEAYKISPDLVAFKKQYEDLFRIMERLEGRISHTSTHAGGVVIYPDLGKYIPLVSDKDDRNKRVVAFDKYAVEDMGFCKIDCLGLEALTTLNTIVNSIKEHEGIVIDFETINYEDSAIYEAFCKGDVSSIFQLEGQRDLTLDVQPRCFDDLVAISSICRPGTCDVNEYLQRRKTKAYTVPEEQKSYMLESEGLIIYQEQYEQLAQTYAGWSIDFADTNIRKNKNLKTDVALKEKFIADSIANGWSKEYVEPIWETIVGVASGGYGFNKSHAVSYTYITYRMAWLKHYYPNYFYAGALTKLYKDDKKRHLLPNSIAECKQKGITILPPDINLSMDNFIPTKDGIRFAITSIKGMGESSLQHLYELRPIASLEDMVSRATRRLLRENVVDNLIKAGCFDREGVSRYNILKEYKSIIKSKKVVEEKDDLEYEHEAIGVYLKKHIMDNWFFKSFYDFPDNNNCLIAGVVRKVEEKFDKKGNKMAFISLETQYGIISCLAFSSYWSNASERQKYSNDAIVMIKGKRSGTSCIIWETDILK